MGTWADVCNDGTVCTEFSCGVDRDGAGPKKQCGDISTGSFTLLGCRPGYVEFSDPPECVEVPAGSLLSRLPSGVLTRNPFVCPFGTFKLEGGNGHHSQNYTDGCAECPERAQCVGGANMPECLPGTYSIGSGQGTFALALRAPLRFVEDVAP